MIEVAAVIGKNGDVLLWHEPAGRTGGSVPDSRDLWTVVWENRDQVQGIAHSHPGSGWTAPSYTDIGTFRAIELALGRPIDWWITTSDKLMLFRSADHWQQADYDRFEDLTPRWWAGWLREKSRYHEEKKHG